MRNAAGTRAADESVFPQFFRLFSARFLAPVGLHFETVFFPDRKICSRCVWII